MRNECTICENDSLMKLAEVEIENERLRDWRYRLEQALEQSHEMIKALREENEEQANKLRIYQEHCLNEHKEKSDDYEMPETKEVNDALHNLITALGKMGFKGEADV